MDFNKIKIELNKLTLEEYDQFLEVVMEEQKTRFGKTLANTTYIGERPILPKYEVSLVPKEHFFPAR